MILLTTNQCSNVKPFFNYLESHIQNHFFVLDISFLLYWHVKAFTFSDNYLHGILFAAGKSDEI